MAEAPVVKPATAPLAAAMASWLATPVCATAAERYLTIESDALWLLLQCLHVCTVTTMTSQDALLFNMGSMPMQHCIGCPRNVYSIMYAAVKAHGGWVTEQSVYQKQM